MIGAVGAAPAIAPWSRATHAPPPEADPELAKAKRKLADWETCPSGKTSAGQAKIKEYAAPVSAIESRDQAAQRAAQLDATQSSGPGPGGGDAPSPPSAARPGSPVAAGRATASVDTGATLGTRIDLYA